MFLGEAFIFTGLLFKLVWDPDFFRESDFFGAVFLGEAFVLTLIFLGDVATCGLLFPPVWDLPEAGFFALDTVLDVGLPDFLVNTAFLGLGEAPDADFGFVDDFVFLSLGSTFNPGFGFGFVDPRLASCLGFGFGFCFFCVGTLKEPPAPIPET